MNFKYTLQTPFILFALLFVGLAFTTSCKKTEGCTNPNSLNYDPDAKKDDGSCIEAVKEQKAMVLEYTATWCGPCGQWGTPKVHELENANGEDIVVLGLHASGDPMYVADLYADFKASRNTSSIPTFFIGDDKTYNQSAIDNIMSKSPVASTEAIISKTATDINLEVQTKFWEATSGEYYLVAFVLENGIDGGSSAPSNYQQNGTSDPNYLHDNVVRASFAGGANGEMIASGSITNGQTINKTYKMTINSGWKAENLHVVTVLWKNEGGMYKFVNINKHEF